jgi:hypothetical protein
MAITNGYFNIHSNTQPDDFPFPGIEAQFESAL